MPYFFFGTLMDRDVLEIVLGRPLSGSELVPARLHGYRRVRTARRPYPMLKPDPGGIIEGRLLVEASQRDATRIGHFEGDEYAERPVKVRSPSGGETEARAFFALAGLGETEEPWELAGWAAQHKAGFLEQCRDWMRDCPL